MPSVLPVISVKALIDTDQNGGPPTDPRLVPLPVAMIENLLLAPEVIWDYLEPHREKCRLKNAAEVADELNAIAKDRRTAEIAMRVQKMLPARTVRLCGATFEDVRGSLDEEINSLRTSLADGKALQEVIDTATKEVDKVMAEGRALLRFHGKELLRAFHQRHVHPLGVGYATFAIQLAQLVGKTAKYRDEFAGDILPKLGIQKAVAPRGRTGPPQ